jgi:site-specific DNA-methyltransferase (adenine-specific)
LYYVKGKKAAYFNPPRIVSERQRLGDKRADPKGRVPGDVWSDFPRVCGNFKERTDHPCQMPEALLERILLTSCPPDGVVLDPFSGSGVAEVVGKKLGLNVLGCELSEKYATAARKRLMETPCPT